MTINWDPTGRRMYLYEPHQDDGALFMAQVAAHHVLAGREVHVVLMSNGSTTSVRDKLNGVVHSGPWWGGFHDPAHEGYEPFLPSDIAVARANEWRESWTALGVPPERLHFGVDHASVLDLPDAITGQYAVDVMRYWNNEDVAAGRPNSGHWTMHWTDTTVDHANCGQALRHLRTVDPDFADGRWLVRTEQQGTVTGAQAYVVPAQFLAEAKAMQKRAALAYGAWAPRQGSVAIGMHSVSSLFQGPLTGAANWIVKNL